MGKKKKKGSTKKPKRGKKKGSTKKSPSGGTGQPRLSADDVSRVFAIQAACRELELAAMSCFMTHPERFRDVIGLLHTALRGYSEIPAADCMGDRNCPPGWCCDLNSGVCQHYCGPRYLCGV